MASIGLDISKIGGPPDTPPAPPEPPPIDSIPAKLPPKAEEP